LLFVLGNDHIELENLSGGRGCINIDNKVRMEKGLIVAGLGGCMRRQKSQAAQSPARNIYPKNEFTSFQMYLRILKLLPALFFNRLFHGRYVDILLTHACPLGIHDKKDAYYRGFKSFLVFMKIFKPKYLVHGHIHLYDTSQERTTKYFDTLVINAYSYYAIDTEEKTP
jgi:Icc-related predicted phosphoesterase